MSRARHSCDVRNPFTESPPSRGRQAAFTLIEVLIAIAILAVALAATSRAASLATDAAVETRIRLLATWAAQNRIAELRARGAFPDPATTKLDAQEGGLDLVIEETVTGTANPTMRRVDESVAAVREPGRVLATLTGYVAR
jgi:general secretion pathway protein I